MEEHSMRILRTWTAAGLTACLVFIAGNVMAQTTGKIAGRIVDKATGEPLFGANVLIKGTQLGAASDASGEFYILNLHPGEFTVEARMIGYKTHEVSGVRISVNRTARFDIEMESSVLEGEVVSVQADRVAIKKDQTNSIRNISAKDISILPAEDIAAVVRMQPGIVDNHFRGGRSNEAVFMIDGIKVTESFNHTGRSVDVNPEAVADIEVITGTFNAEYGDAMSGVVNVITKEGGQKFSGALSGYLGNYLSNHDDIFVGLDNGDVTRNTDFKWNLSGPLISNKLSFITDGRYVENDGYLWGVHYFNPYDYSNYDSDNEEEWITTHSGDSTLTPMNWNKNLLLYGKLTYRATNSLKLSLAATANKGENHWYSHGNKYNPFGMPYGDNESLLLTYQMNQMIGRSAFFEFKLAWSDYQVGNYMYKDPSDPRYVHNEYSRSNGFSTGGDSKGHTVRSEKNLNMKFDFSWQLNRNHYLKTGVDFTRIGLDQQYSTIQNGYNGSGLEYMYAESVNGRDYMYYKPVTYPDSSVHSDIYTHNPIKFAFYLQDKMEFESMVVNLGLRFDYFIPDATYPTNYRNPANQLHQVEESRYSDYPDADVQYQISPRIGLSYQLGESALLRFSYGHFLQLPPLNYYYQNNSYLVRAPDFSSRMGNANLNPQKTVQYEVGLWQQLSDQMNVEVAVYYRDIYDLVSATTFTTYDQIRYGVYTNLEYGSARGLEIKYDFRQGPISAGVNYTLGYTRGVADNPEMSFTRAGSEMDPVNKMIPMSWDQRHVFNTFCGYQTPKFGATAMFYYYSGTAYTWTPLAQSPLARINLFPNNQHRPSRFNVDLNAHFNLLTIRGMKFKLSLLAYNLLDRLNEHGVNSNTGRAYQVIIQDTDLMGHRSVYHEYEEQVLNPANFAAPRLVKLGIGVTF